MTRMQTFFIVAATVLVTAFLVALLVAPNAGPECYTVTRVHTDAQGKETARMTWRECRSAVGSFWGSK